jgi:hypothetical protein
MLVAFAAAPGCAAEEPVRASVQSGHILLYHDVDPACAGEIEEAAAFLDRAATGMAEFLTVPMPSVVEYHLLHGEAWQKASPCPTALGCTNQAGVVYAQRIIPHELGHALLRHAIGKSRVNFFEEGVAEALGGQWADAIDVPASVDDLLGVEQIPQDKYDVAGRLVGYLLVERGPALMLEFLDNVPDGTPAAEVHSAFSSVYGSSIDAALADVAASPLVLGSLGIGYCSGAASLAQDGPLLEAVKTTPACGNPVGSFRIELPTDGIRQIDWFGSDKATFIDMRRCPVSQDGAPVAFFGASNYLAPRRTEFAEMGAGRYFVNVIGPAGLDTTLRITDAPRGLSCADAFELSSEHDSLELTPAVGQTLRVFLRAQAGIGPATVHAPHETSGLPILCDGCETGTCTALDDRDTFELTEGITYTFEFTAGAEGDRAALAF